jgi:hypothetical protein
MNAMNPKLLEVLKKAKQVDQRAKKFDSTDSATLEANINSRKTKPTMSESVGNTNMISQQQMMVEQPTQVSRPQPMVDVNSDTYKQRVKESKLPPEIMQAMLDNPIQQPDSPGTFSMDEEMIKQVNPNYGKKVINETSKNFNEEFTQTQKNYSIDENLMRKMIAEEITKALPSIVENYFDKKIIKENIEVLKAIKVRRKTNNTR